MTALSPCPFCGTIPDVGIYPESGDSPRGYFCICSWCRASTSMSSDRVVAVAIWNRRAPSSAKPDPGDSSRDHNPPPPDSGLLPTEGEREGGWDPRTDPLAYMIYRTLDVMGVVRLTAKQAMWVASEVRRYGLPLPPADHGADVRPSDSERSELSATDETLSSSRADSGGSACGATEDQHSAGGREP